MSKECVEVKFEGIKIKTIAYRMWNQRKVFYWYSTFDMELSYCYVNQNIYIDMKISLDNHPRAWFQYRHNDFQITYNLPNLKPEDVNQDFIEKQLEKFTNSYDVIKGDEEEW